MTARRVAACVITGFLGSGKTTLLKGLLDRDPSRERIAVIVNEIGEIGIDGRVLTGFEFIENVVELASGCVCCSIDEYRFDLAVEELVRRLDPLLVVLETSGVADPGPTLDRLKRSGLGIDAVVTVVDAWAWRRAWRIGGAARRQVRAADFLVLSKTDLVSPRALERLRKGLARVNPRALVLEGKGALDFAGSELLLATSAARRSGAWSGGGEGACAALSGDEEGPSHLEKDRLESFSWSTGREVDRIAVERVLETLPADVLRAKGFLHDAGQQKAWLFQSVCGRLEMTTIEAGKAITTGMQGVFIGTGISRFRDDIVARLRACERKDDQAAPGGAPRRSAASGSIPG
ncbi:MAG: GTP-binding protein [Candidatus Binatia bacterium]